jgi:hypothetical protein
MNLSGACWRYNAVAQRRFGEAEGRLSNGERRAARGREGYPKERGILRVMSCICACVARCRVTNMIYKHVENIQEPYSMAYAYRSRTMLGARGVPGVSPSTISPTASVSSSAPPCSASRCPHTYELEWPHRRALHCRGCGLRDRARRSGLRIRTRLLRDSRHRSYGSDTGSTSGQGRRGIESGRRRGRQASRRGHHRSCRAFSRAIRCACRAVRLSPRGPRPPRHRARPRSLPGKPAKVRDMPPGVVPRR